MKRLLIATLLAASAPAFAGSEVWAVGTNAAGGHNAIMKDSKNCASGLGFLAEVPFSGSIRGCVTSYTPDGKSFHVYFENNMEMDYVTSTFTKVAPDEPKGAAL